MQTILTRLILPLASLTIGAQSLAGQTVMIDGVAMTKVPSNIFAADLPEDETILLVRSDIMVPAGMDSATIGDSNYNHCRIDVRSTSLLNRTIRAWTRIRLTGKGNDYAYFPASQINIKFPVKSASFPSMYSLECVRVPGGGMIEVGVLESFFDVRVALTAAGSIN